MPTVHPRPLLQASPLLAPFRGLGNAAWATLSSLASATPFAKPSLLATASRPDSHSPEGLARLAGHFKQGWRALRLLAFPARPSTAGCQSDTPAVETGNNAAWADPGNLAKLTPIGQPNLLFVRTSGMEPSRTPATPPGPGSATWRSSRPLASPVCSLTWAGPTRTLPPAWQRRQGDSRNLVELWPIGLPCRLPGSRRPNPAPHRFIGSAQGGAGRQLGHLSMPRTSCLVVPLPISVGVLFPLP
jgi:hypothetical protein